ncbi:MAG: helix-turn-helix domain-containing protein [Nitrososphaeraceae archaeon]
MGSGNDGGGNSGNVNSSKKPAKNKRRDLKEDAIDLRRERILELTAQGYSQRQIANMLQISHGTVGNEQMLLRHKAKENIREYLDERLPDEYEKCMVGINSILREAWITSQDSEDKREKIQALSLAKECYSMKLDLLTNAIVVDDAIRFVYSNKAKEKLKSASNSSRSEDNNSKSNEPDYDEDKDQLEEEQEEETGETTSATTNHVF